MAASSSIPPRVERADGQFCWFDLKTRDLQRTAAFLAATLGWQVRSEQRWRPMTFLTVEGFDIGGLSDLRAPIYPPGLPAHIACYLAVADVEAAIDAAVAAGAQLLVPAFDVGDEGRIATLLDPFGAAVSLWQRAGEHGWMHPPTLHGCPVGATHRSVNPSVAGAFYRTALRVDDDSLAWETGTGGWQLVVGVPSIAAVAARVREFGAGACVVSRGDVDHCGLLTTPDGIEIAVRAS